MSKLPMPPNTPDDMDMRERLMQSDVLLVAIAAASLLQGLPGAPLLFPVVTLLKLFLSGTFLGSPLVVTYLGSMLASAITLVIAGVPAALYERAKGLSESSTLSLGIWLIATLVLVGLPHLLLPS
jgi:hypothetical protein